MFEIEFEWIDGIEWDGMCFAHQRNETRMWNGCEIGAHTNSMKTVCEMDVETLYRHTLAYCMLMRKDGIRTNQNEDGVKLTTKNKSTQAHQNQMEHTMLGNGLFFRFLSLKYTRKISHEKGEMRKKQRMHTRSHHQSCATK